MKASVDVRSLHRYCVVCGQEFGPSLKDHCTPTSLVAVQTKGLFKKRRLYFSLDGIALGDQDLLRLRDRERAAYSDVEANRPARSSPLVGASVSPSTHTTHHEAGHVGVDSAVRPLSQQLSTLPRTDQVDAGALPADGQTNKARVITSTPNDEISRSLFRALYMYPCSLEGVQEFLEEGADVNWVDPFSGRISLHNVTDAHEQDHPDIVKALLDAGANPNVRDRLEVQTPLMYAAAHGYTESVRILIDAGADASIVDNNRRTALMLAEEEGHYEIVDLLSSSGPATRSDERFESLADMVQHAIDWSSEDDEVSKEFGEPIRVTKSCRTCFHFNEHQGLPYAVCADYHDPTASGPNEPISIPESLADEVWCESWKEEDLAKLLVRGWEPGGINYHRRHPIITKNPEGARMFVTRVLDPGLRR